MGFYSIFALIALVSNVCAQGQSSDSWGGGGGGGSSSMENAFANGNFPSGLGFNVSQIDRIRLAHGILASLAFVVLFPAGGIIIRLFPGRAALFIHAAFQLMAYVVYTAAFGMGVYLVRTVHIGSFDFLKQSSTSYHPIIGILVFVVLLFQPILGVIHHKVFKQKQRRQIWSYSHIWIGRIFITLGIINGGLGLKVTDNTTKGNIAYGVVSAIFWLAWMATAVYGEIQRRKHKPSPAPENKEGEVGGPGVI